MLSNRFCSTLCLQRIAVALIACHLTVLTASAQGDVEYRAEIGAGAGMVNYLGDFNGSLTGEMQPMGSIVARWLFNPYMGSRVNLSYGKLKGSSKGLETYYPDYADNPYEFDRSLVDLSMMFEYNLRYHLMKIIILMKQKKNLKNEVNTQLIERIS